MKAQLKVRSNLIIEVEGETPVDTFRELAAAQEVFEQEKCGCCGLTGVRFVTRKDSEENEYFEMHCQAPGCRARLPFGQNKKPKGALYPKKRWDSLSEGEQAKRAEDKTYADQHYGVLPNGGWYKYKPEKKEQ